NQATQFTVRCLHGDRRGLDSNRFSNRADLEANVDYQAVVGVKCDSGLLGTLESGMRGVNLVVAKREIRKVVLSVTAGECSSVERSVHVGDGDLGTCNRRALLIRYRAADSCRSHLGSCAESCAQSQRK